MAIHDGAPWVNHAVLSILGERRSELELIVADDSSANARARGGERRSSNAMPTTSRCPSVRARQVASCEAYPDVGFSAAPCGTLTVMGGGDTRRLYVSRQRCAA